MTERKFKKGDTVRFDCFEQKGTGTIVGTDDSLQPYLVYSMDIVDGHDGGGYIDYQGTCYNWWFREENLELVQSVEEDIPTTLTFNGVEYNIEVVDGVLHGTEVVKELPIKTVYNLKKGDEYWCVDTNEVTLLTWANDEFDLGALSSGSVFLTKEEAQFEKERREFMTKMRRDFTENTDTFDWDNPHQRKYHINLIDSDGEISIDYWARYQVPHDIPVTTNDKWLHGYIAKNKEDIKKYYFGANK